MHLSIKFAPNRDDGGSNVPPDDLVLDLFSGAAKHFEPIDDDEDDEEQQSAVKLVAQTSDRPTSISTAPSAVQEPQRPTVVSMASKPSKEPPKRTQSGSRWDDLAAALGLESEQPPRESEPVGDSSAGQDSSSSARPIPAGTESAPSADEDMWKKSVADLFQIDPSEIPDRAVLRDSDDPEEDEVEFETDIDADFVEFEIKDLAPGNQRRAESTGDRPAGQRDRDSRRPRSTDRSRESSRGTSKPGARTTERTPAPARDQNVPANRESRRSRVESKEPAEAPRRGQRRPKPEDAEGVRPEPQRPERKRTSPSARSNAPASADLMHEDDDFIDTPDGESKRVTSWTEAIEVIIEKNLSTRRRGGSSSGSRRPRGDRRR